MRCAGGVRQGWRRRFSSWNRYSIRTSHSRRRDSKSVSAPGGTSILMPEDSSVLAQDGDGHLRFGLKVARRAAAEDGRPHVAALVVDDMHLPGVLCHLLRLTGDRRVVNFGLSSNLTSQELLRTMQRVGAHAGKSSQDLPFAASGNTALRRKSVSKYDSLLEGRQASFTPRGAFVCQPCLGSPWGLSNRAPIRRLCSGPSWSRCPAAGWKYRVFFRGRVSRVIRGRLRSRGGLRGISIAG